jgi:hypothetical protein
MAANYLIPYSGEFYPVWSPGDNTAVIQAALNAAQSAGGGVVDLGNYSWTISGSGLSIDCSTTSLRGYGATINCTNISIGASAITVTNSGAIIFGNMVHSIEGIILKTTDNGTRKQVGITFFAPTSNYGFYSTILLKNLLIEGFYWGWFLNNNSYVISNVYVNIQASTGAGIYVNASVYTLNNAGENVNWYGCTISNNVIPWFIVQCEMYFHSCSFDFNFFPFGFMDYANVNWIGCHFEASYVSAGFGQPTGTASGGNKTITVTGILPPPELVTYFNSNGQPFYITFNSVQYNVTACSGVASGSTLTTSTNVGAGTNSVLNYIIPPFFMGHGTYVINGGQFGLSNGAAAGPIANSFFGTFNSGPTTCTVKLIGVAGFFASEVGTSANVSGINGVFYDSTNGYSNVQCYQMVAMRSENGTSVTGNGTVNLNCCFSEFFEVALTGNTTIGAPINAVEGFTITIIIQQTTGNAFTLSWTTGAGTPDDWDFGSLTAPAAPNAGSFVQVVARYSWVARKWLVQSVTGGY